MERPWGVTKFNWRIPSLRPELVTTIFLINPDNVDCGIPAMAMALNVKGSCSPISHGRWILLSQGLMSQGCHSFIPHVWMLSADCTYRLVRSCEWNWAFVQSSVNIPTSALEDPDDNSDSRMYEKAPLRIQVEVFGAMLSLCNSM